MFGIFKVSSLIQLLALLLALNVTSVIATQSPHVTKIKSKVYGVDREIMVSLPSGYQQDKDKIYPVIYFTDAQMHIPHAAPMIQFLAGGISELIVVGVQTFDRQNELSPYREDGSEFSKHHGAEQLLKFIETEVKPHINTTYRTAPFEILSGHSLGGLFTMFAFTRHPETFDAYFALSPTLAYANSSILNELDARLSNLPKNKILVAYSEQETPFKNQYKAFNQFLMLLKTKAPDGFDSQARFISGEDHMTIAHLGLYHALRHTFRDWWLFSNAMVGAPEKFDAHYKRLSTRLGYEVIPEFNELWALTAYLIRERHYKEANYLIKKWQTYYPKKSAPYYELAQLYVAQNNFLQAAEHIRLAIEYAKPNSNQYRRSKDLQQTIKDKL